MADNHQCSKSAQTSRDGGVSGGQSDAHPTMHDTHTRVRPRPHLKAPATGKRALVTARFESHIMTRKARGGYQKGRGT
jgi:hypothetical protein